MNSQLSGVVNHTKKWLNAIHSASGRILSPEPEVRLQRSHLEALSTALRLREEFKSVMAGNAQMLQALQSFKERQARLSALR